jgi:Arc/MetJ-type ribon-helix-helix transcriptional regulator
MSCMQTSELFPCKLSSQLESEVAEAARSRNKTASELLEEIVREWLDRHQGPEEADQALQEQWRAAAMKVVGAIEREDLSAENASAEVKAKLMRRYAR